MTFCVYSVLVIWFSTSARRGNIHWHTKLIEDLFFIYINIYENFRSVEVREKQFVHRQIRGQRDISNEQRKNNNETDRYRN